MDQNNQVPQVTPPITLNGWYKAGVLRRYFALLIDGILLIPFNFVLFILIIIFARGNKNLYLSALLLSLMPSLLFAAYNTFSIWKYGATLGKKWLKVKVISINSQPLTLGQVILRETIGRFLSGMVFQLGYLWAIWDKNRQTWHDKIAKTYVVTTIPNDGKNPWWLYLVLILPFISVIAILAAVVILAINPLNLVRTSKDTTRLSDLAKLKTAIQIAQVQNPAISLCTGSIAPCKGDSKSSDLANRNVNGTGWVKVDLSQVELTPKLLILPIDPTNSLSYYYRYCFDGVGWELNAKLESSQNKLRMQNDGGDDPSSYEIGTNLRACQD